MCSCFNCSELPITYFSQGGCAFIAALLQYLFLAAFSWMLCEGIMLYLLLVVVFSTLSKRWWFFLLLGYGLLISSCRVKWTSRENWNLTSLQCRNPNTSCCGQCGFQTSILWCESQWRVRIVSSLLWCHQYVYINHMDFNHTSTSATYTIILRPSKLKCLYSSCWLSTEKGTIWAFVGPMLAIIIVRE